jgi:EpsI family protein
MNGVSLRLYAVVAMVVGAYGVSRWLQIATAPPEVEMPGWKLAELPMQLGNWLGETAELDEKIAAATGAVEIENRRYHNELGHVLSLHTAMFTDPAVGVYHSPLNCYPANGWKKLSETSANVPVPNAATIAVRVVSFEKDGEKYLVAYWYQLGNRVLYEREDLGKIRWEMRGQSKWPVLLKVMVQTQVAEGQNSRASLRAFTKEIGAWLNQPEHRKYLARWSQI